jgi:hypothetical protein
MTKNQRRMKMKVDYVMDEVGNKKAVLIPFHDWVAYQQEHSRLQQRAELKRELERAFKDIDDVRKGRTKVMTKEDVLNDDRRILKREGAEKEQLSKMESQLRKAFKNLDDIHRGKKKAKTIADIVNEL